MSSSKKANPISVSEPIKTWMVRGMDECNDFSSLQEMETESDSLISELLTQAQQELLKELRRTIAYEENIDDLVRGFIAEKESELDKGETDEH